MSKSDLAASISETIADYRAGAIPNPTPAHVIRWIDQFDSAARVPLLREIDHVLSKTYLSRRKIRAFLRGMLRTDKIVTGDPVRFWRGVDFLDLQTAGNSQRDLLDMLNGIMAKEFGFTTSDCGGNAHHFLYLDDGLFSGGRIQADLVRWIAEEAPDRGDVYVVTCVTHTQGRYFTEQAVKRAVREHGKSIDFRWLHITEYENNPFDIRLSDVLRPVSIPDDPAIAAYAKQLDSRAPGKHPLRPPGNTGRLSLFSSEESRHLVEQELLKAGVRIREACPNLPKQMRPLGATVQYMLGFGTMVVTYRNSRTMRPWRSGPARPGTRCSPESSTRSRR